MKFTISRTSLFHALQKVIGVVPNRSTLQILTNVLVYSEDGRLKLVGTDLELTMISTVDATIEVEGGLAMPAKILNDILKELPEEELHFEVDENHRVKLKSQLGMYKIAGESQQEFPPPPAIDSASTLELPATVLKRMIDKTTFATSSDELRPALTGVLCHFSADEAKFVATDGHRLVKIVNKSIHYDGNAQIILPTKALNFLQKQLEAGDSVTLSFDAKHVLFELDNIKLFSKIITEDYPDFERALPTQNKKQLYLNNASFIASVKRISLFANPMTNQVRVSLSPNLVQISAEDIDVGGEAKEELACNYDHDPMEIGYNAVYLLDVLRHVDADEIVLKLDTSLSGTLVQPVEQKADEDLVMLVMPVRLNER